MRLNRRRTAVAALVATFIVATSGASYGVSRVVTRVQSAAGYVSSRQVANGAFFSANTPADAVAEAAAVVAAAGGAPDVVASAMRYVSANGPARSRGRGGHAARIVLGIGATGGDPRAFGGTDFVALLRDHFNPVTGTYDTGVYANALATLAAASVGIAADDRTVGYFRLAACSNGGLSHEAGCVQKPDVDTTAMTVIALRASGVSVTDELVADARGFLLKARNASGAWGLESGNATNANSTGLAIAAVIALGERTSASPWATGGRDPLAALTSLQLPSGAFSYMAGQPANDYATVQALPALLGTTYPLRSPAEIARSSSGLGTTATRRNVVARENTQAQAGSPEPTTSVDPKESRAARVESTLGDRSTGSGTRVLVMWLSLLIAGSLIAVPIIIRRKRAG